MARFTNFTLYLLFLLLLSGGLIFTSVVAFKLQQHERHDAIQDFSAMADRFTLKVQERLSGFAVVSRSSTALFNGSSQVTRSDWYHFTERLRSDAALTGIDSMGFIPLSGRDPHRSGKPFYPQKSDSAFVLYQRHFGEPDNHLSELDLFSIAPFSSAMTKARNTEDTALSASVRTAGRTLPPMVFEPVFKQSAEFGRVFTGWVFVSINTAALFESINSNWQRQHSSLLSLQVNDGSLDNGTPLLYQLGQAQTGSHPDFQQLRMISVNDHQWLLVFNHLAPEASINNTPAQITLGAGLMLTLLILLLFYSAITTRRRASKMAESLAEDIRRQEDGFNRLANRLNLIAGRVPGMIFEFRRTADGHISFPYVSEGIRQLFGLAPEQAERDASPIFSRLNPHDLETMTRTMLSSASRLTPWRQEFRTTDEQGRVRWLLGSAQPQRQARGVISWCGIVTDISHRKEAELALKKAHNQARYFREALDQVSAYIYMKDTQHQYIYANRAALSQLGCNSATLAGSRDEQFFSAEISAALQASDQRVLAGEPLSEEVEITGKDGRCLIYLDVKSPIYEDTEQTRIIGLLGIRTDITLLKNSEKQLRQLAHFDPLTKLHNRVLLADRLQQAMTQARRHQQSIAVVYLDLDGFKAVNDNHGHEAGDKLLIAIADRMKQVIRAGDTLARVGGDEFVAILLDLGAGEQSPSLLQRLLQAAAGPVSVNGIRLQVSASLGVTFYPQESATEPEQLLRQADQAMYQAKLSGKNRYYLFDTERDNVIRTHHESLARIRQALFNNEFVLHYQPKVNMRTGKVIGAEALLRWQHPQKGLLLPCHFLPVIEDHNLASQLGHHVLDMALEQLQQWHQQGLKLTVSVNLSAQQLRQPDFVEQLKCQLARYSALSPGWLELEVLETSALGDLTQVSARLEQCRALGVGIALDDFGTGYSSLTYLKQLPAGTVKIDKSFVHNILSVPEDMTLLDGILSLARAFGRKVVAEGVETPEHGSMLLRLGCELAQGFAIAHPMPAGSLTGWVAHWTPPAQWASAATINKNMLPLLYAGMEHQQWLTAISTALQHEQALWPHLDDEDCRLGHFLKNKSQQEQPPFRHLYTMHTQLHELAAQLQQWQQQGRLQQALDGFDTLLELHKSMTDELEQCLQPDPQGNVTPLRRSQPF